MGARSMAPEAKIAERIAPYRDRLSIATGQ